MKHVAKLTKEIIIYFMSEVLQIFGRHIADFDYKLLLIRLGFMKSIDIFSQLKIGFTTHSSELYDLI